MILVKLIKKVDPIIDEILIGPLIKTTKVIRTFKFIYESQILKNLSKLINAFMQTFKNLTYYMVMLIFFSFCCSLIFYEIL